MEIEEEAPALPVPSGRTSIRETASRIVLALVMEDTFRMADLVQEHGADMTPQRFGLALHEARERMRKDHRVEWVPLRGAPGTYVRADARRKLTRGQSFMDTARRKRKRAGDVLAAIDPAELSAQDQERLRLTQDKNQHALMREAQAARMRREDPVR